MSVRHLSRSHPHGTPSPLSPLIGRQTEIAAALALLADPDVRILTLTGPGGIGKTRLALRVAADGSDEFADGVLVVSLAAIRDPAFLVSSIAQAAGAPELTTESALIERFCHRELLVLLDNFESNGQTMWLPIDLKAGTYAAVCFVTDPSNGKPHAMEGMLKVFTVK